VDEIYSDEGAEKSELTSVEKAGEFLNRTGVDILVPNVGTEHRKTSQEVVYAAEQARKISEAVGKILCLHGTSSVRKEHIPGLPDDGFVKINIYTTLAVHGGQAVAREVLGTIGSILSEAELRSLIDDGVLGHKALEAASTGPRLTNVANPLRRDAWFGAVREQCLHYMELLNYQNWRS
jgi:fructose-bisphosphate aldolase class II